MPGQKRFTRQINRLGRLGMHKPFDVQDGGLETWLRGFKIEPYLLNETGSSIVLPSRKRSHDGDLWDYYKLLLPNLEMSCEPEGVAVEKMAPQMRRNGRVNPYVLQHVSFDPLSKVAEEAVKDWVNSTSNLCRQGLIGLTVEELVTLLAYNSEHFDAMLAIGSVSDNGIVPCLEPKRPFGKWLLSFKRFSDLGKNVDDGDHQRWRWSKPYGGALRLTAPTAMLILPA